MVPSKTYFSVTEFLIWRISAHKRSLVTNQNLGTDKINNKKRGHTNGHGHEHTQNTTKPRKKLLVAQLHSKNRAHSSSPRLNNRSSPALSR
ncbi:hypothetical protein C1H46_005550 [Malus baccata]|uniref:Uncharacterized protein n=1 Tax=Malus baccata TaxID=106549 RepID=A0A540NCS8_MALBA|nr:hypothetical protein C1H46_005550 [Malus baccata]